MPVAEAKEKRGLSKQPAFLAAYIASASVTKAAKAAKIDRALHYRWLAEDEAYAQAFAAAQREAAQALEDEAVRRAHEGHEEPLTYQGQFSYPVDEKTGKRKKGAKPLAITRYSDGLLQFLLKGFRPEKYAHKSVEISGPAGGPIKLENESLAKLSDDELTALIGLAAKLKPE